MENIQKSFTYWEAHEDLLKEQFNLIEKLEALAEYLKYSEILKCLENSEHSINLDKFQQLSCFSRFSVLEEIECLLEEKIGYRHSDHPEV